LTLNQELKDQVARIFADQWTTRDGKVVPDDKSVTLGNDGINLDATVLYADLAASTFLVDTKSGTFAAEIYKAYLVTTAKIIRAEGGAITAYDGDRIMAVFIGDNKNTSAARTALKINWSVINIINPAIKKQYNNANYAVKQIVGIDTSSLIVAKTGVRGANDLVWVGRAANYAAKLSNLSSYSTYITHTVYDKLHASAKYTGGDESKPNLWHERTWTTMNNMKIYGSDGWWSIS